MKRLSITIVLFLLVLQRVNAQNQKGDQTLGLGLNFGANSGNFNYLGNNGAGLDYTSSTTAYFSTNLNYGYFMAHNLDIGADIGFGNGTANYNDHTTNTTTKEVDKNYYSALYVRKYFLFNNKIGIRTGPYIAYQYFGTNDTYTPANSQPANNINGSNYHVGLIADFVYYPSKKIGLAVNLGNLSYNYGKMNYPQQNNNNSGINLQFLNNSLMLSAYYVFGD
jgi:hypothetical protein